MAIPTDYTRPIKRASWITSGTEDGPLRRAIRQRSCAGYLADYLAREISSQAEVTRNLVLHARLGARRQHDRTAAWRSEPGGSAGSHHMAGPDGSSHWRSEIKWQQPAWHGLLNRLDDGLLMTRQKPLRGPEVGIPRRSP